jgi:sulfite exporter TauE/SafE
VAYLMVFGLGTIAGMMFITAAISVPFTLTARRSVQFNRRLGVATSFLSVCFGLFLVYQIGFVEGLFK